MSRCAGVGIDVLSVSRLERAIERRPGLADRLFTKDELNECEARARPGRHLAARFCAKEAAMKALAMHSAAIGDFEVVGGGREAPRMVLSGAAARRAEELDVRVDVSLSHDQDIATAVAVLVGA